MNKLIQILVQYRQIYNLAVSDIYNVDYNENFLDFSSWPNVQYQNLE